MSKINLVHCISSLKMGGAEEVVCSLIEALPAEQYTQSVIYFHDGPHRKRLEESGIKCYQIQGFVAPFDPVAFGRFLLRIKKLKPDVMHSALWLANLFTRITGKLLRIKTINSLHNTITRDHDGLVRMLIDKLSLFLADTIIAVTPAVAASAPQNIQYKIRVIPNGINQEKLLSQKKITRTELNLTSEHFVIGAVGRFVPVKNHALLISCFAQLHQKYPDSRLVLLGTGPLEQALRAHTQKLMIADYVTFVIGQPAQHYYSLFDCFVQPSKNEGLSIALLEALTFSLPVIVTGKTHQHAVITTGQTGLVIEPDNHTELYIALEKLIEEKPLSNRLTSASCALADNYGIQAMADKYNDLFMT